MKTEPKPGDRVECWDVDTEKNKGRLISVNPDAYRKYVVHCDDRYLGVEAWEHAELLTEPEFQPGEMVEVSDTQGFPSGEVYKRKYMFRDTHGIHVCEHRSTGAKDPIRWLHCRKLTPWQPVEGEPVAAWHRGNTNIYLGIAGHPFQGYAFHFYARIPESFDPKNPDHYAVTWWENCGTDIWRP
jgi:hypothetical protein